MKISRSVLRAAWDALVLASLLSVAAMAAVTANAVAASELPMHEWQQDVSHLPLPGAGCFNASYPDVQWHATACGTPPTKPYAPAQGPRPQSVGNGNDFSAEVTGVMSSATGTIPNVSSGASETGVQNGAGSPVPDTFSLQLNTQFFSTPACAGAGNPAFCEGWQQFLYSTTSNEVFMQYWLIRYEETCPSGWIQYVSGAETSCFMNSIASPLSGGPATVSDLEQTELTGTADSNGDDTVVMTTANGTATASGAGSVLSLGSAWKAVEFAIVGDCCGAQAEFSPGSTITVDTTTHSETTEAPTCVLEGFTGETNSLELDGTPALPTQAAPTLSSQQTNGAGTPGSCAAAKGLGDTHLTTFLKRLLYDFQASGQYVLATTGPQFEVQNQQKSGKPKWPNADVNQAIAAKVGTSSVAICTEPERLAVNNTTTTLASGAKLLLPGGGDVSRNGNTYLIRSSTGDSVRAEVNLGTPNWINVSVGLGRWPSTVHGLLANAQGNPSAIETLGGTVLSAPFAFGSFYSNYATSWRVPAGQSLLSPCGKAIKWTNPKKLFYAEDLPPETAAAARAICIEAGVVEAALLDACTVDVAVLGEGAAAAYEGMSAPVTWGKIVASTSPGKHLTLSTAGKGALTAGAPLESFSSNLVFTTASGNLECESALLNGTLKTNSASKDDGPVNSSLLEGEYLGIPGACKTSAAGPALVTSEVLPWSSTFKTSGVELKGKKIKFTVTFQALEGPNNKCTFEAAKLKLSYATPISNTPKEESLLMAGQVFKHNKKAANQTSLCPSEGTLAGSLDVTSGGEPVLFAGG